MKVITEEEQIAFYDKVMIQLTDYLSHGLSADNPKFVRLVLLAFDSQDPTQLYHFVGNGPRADSIVAVKTWLARQEKKAQ